MIASKTERAHFAALAREIRLDAPVYLAIALYMAIASLYLWRVGFLDQFAIGSYTLPWLLNFGFILPSLAIGIGAIRIAGRLRQRRLLAIRHMFSSRRTSRFIAGIALLMAIGAFISAFTTVKMALPLESGFAWDVWFADLDRQIGFGHDPWLVLHRVFPPDLFLDVIEFNYNVIWFLICWGFLFWMLTSPKTSESRTRFIICYLSAWVVLGSVMASIFISAGPLFYGEITGDHLRFAGLMTNLAQNADLPTSVYAYHLYLWDAYQNRDAGFGTGISAFPSVHVGVIFVCALFIHEQNRRFGYLAFAYTAIIAASSVYLGWHYASDGIVAVVVVAIIYYFAKLVQVGVSSPTPATPRSVPAGAGLR